MSIRRGLVVFLAGLALIGLAACTSGTTTRTASPAVVTHVKAASPPTPTAKPVPTPSPTSTKALARKDNTVWVGRYPIEIPVDNGPEEFAMGSVTTDQNGVPVAYKVASGDVIDYVAERFGFWVGQDQPGFDYLNYINQVRRGTAPGASDVYFTLYAGDTLNLSPYTMTSVGDTDGRVLSDPLPSPAPPQH